MNIFYKTLSFVCLVFVLLLASCQFEKAPQPLTHDAPMAGMTGGGGSGDSGDDDEPIIQGTVVNSQQSTISNATVDLLNAGGTQVIAQTQTDSQGAFEFDVNDGDYRLEVSATGYNTYTSDTISVNPPVEETVTLN